MTAYSLKFARENLERIAEAVIDDSNPAVITLDSGRAVVMIDLEVYENWKETEYLLSNPANRQRLLISMQDAREGKNLIRKTVEELQQYES